MTDFTDTVMTVENDAMHGPHRYVVAHTCTTCGALTRDRPAHHRWHLTQDVGTALDTVKRLGPDDALVLTVNGYDRDVLDRIADAARAVGLANRVLIVDATLQPRIAPRDQPDTWVATCYGGCQPETFTTRRDRDRWARNHHHNNPGHTVATPPHPETVTPPRCSACGHETGEHTPAGCEVGISGPGRMCGCTAS